MIAIYSYWDTIGDLTKSAGNWSSPKFMLYSLVHSAKKSKEHFGYVKMVTTSSCKEIFEKLEIFDEVTTELDNIAHYPKTLWALGKIYAYSIQKEPFIHIDNDAMFENDKIVELSKGYDFIVQELEDPRYEDDINHPFSKGWYYTYIPTLKFLKEQPKYYLNPNYVEQIKYAYNMGVYGCKDLDFNKRYCEEAFKLVDENINFWVNYEKITKYPNHNVPCFFEQYLIAQMITYHKLNDKVFRVIQNSTPKELGYRHILGSKKSQNWYNWFKNAVEISYPKQDKIINNLIK
jgi:hypothetical protein